MRSEEQDSRQEIECKLIRQAITMLSEQDLSHWSDAHDKVTIAALRSDLASLSTPPDIPKGAVGVLTKIVHAVEGYEAALKRREHGGVAMDKAFWEIRAALSMDPARSAAPVPAYRDNPADENYLCPAGRMQREAASQPAEAVSEAQVFAIFRANCVNYAGNYEVTPGLALRIAERILALAATPVAAPEPEDFRYLQSKLLDILHSVNIWEMTGVNGADKVRMYVRDLQDEYATPSEATPAAHSVACPHCGVKAGEPCIWPETTQGHYRTLSHVARSEAAAVEPTKEGDRLLKILGELAGLVDYLKATAQKSPDFHATLAPWWQAVYKLHALAAMEPANVEPIDFPYTRTFWSISAAVKIEGPKTLAISVKDFQNEWNRRAPMEPVAPAKGEPDTERLNWLDENNKRFRMGWQVGMAPAGNCSVKTIIRGGKPIREAIDEARLGKDQARAPEPADNWRQYAKEGETAQQCIERHRSEQDGLMVLLAKARAEPVEGAEPADVTQALLEVGREMVRITTTVQGMDEWPAIPALWLECMRERDRARAALLVVEGAEPPAHCTCKYPLDPLCIKCTDAVINPKPASAQAGAVPEWLPIETAPKDGRTILLGFMEDGEITQRAEMQWSHIQRNGLFPGAVGMWVCPGGNFTWKDEPKEFGPTHWMPIAKANPTAPGRTEP